MNKSNIFIFIFLQTITLIQLFVLIYLIIKTSPFSKTLSFLTEKNLFNLFTKNEMLYTLPLS